MRKLASAILVLREIGERERNFQKRPRVQAC